MNALLAGVLNSMLPAMAVAAAVEVALQRWRGVNASTRHAVWWMALAAALLLPLAIRDQAPAPGAPAAPFAAPLAPSSPAIASPAPIAPADPGLIEAEGPLMALWLAGASVLLARVAFSYVWLRRTKAKAVMNAAQSHRLENLLLRHGIGRRVRVLESARVHTPMAVGFWRPAVIVPEGFAARVSRDEMQHVLLHEAAHLGRRDDWWNLLARLVRAALWFHPAVIWILRRLEQEREMACDEWVVEVSGQARPYAESLARVAEISMGNRSPLLATGALGAGSRVARRIERLLRPGSLSARVSFPKLAASAAAIGLLVAVCSESPVMVARAVEDERVPKPVDQKPGFLAGLASAGYTSLEVDEIIELKNQGVSPSYIAQLNAAGFGKLSTKELVELHNSGVKAKFVQGLVDAGLGKVSLREIIQMSSHGVRPSDAAAIHRLGFGPYTPEQLIEFSQRGVRVEFFRQLKDSSVTQIDPRDIVEAVSNGVSGVDIREARKYHPNLNMQQIIRLKQAGVI